MNGYGYGYGYAYAYAYGPMAMALWLWPYGYGPMAMAMVVKLCRFQSYTGSVSDGGKINDDQDGYGGEAANEIRKSG